MSSSGTYCDICDVTDHDTEDCPEQMYESLSQDTEAQTGKTRSFEFVSYIYMNSGCVCLLRV